MIEQLVGKLMVCGLAGVSVVTVITAFIVALKTGHNTVPDGDYTIRKLTPLECERLQTVPEGYTEGVSNTQRYKMLGNGWTVDVIAHILAGINLEGLI